MQKFIGDKKAVWIPGTRMLTNGETTITIGNPNTNDESHNCDLMGCTSCEHVVEFHDATEEEKDIYESLKDIQK